ncbi:hypothetical protein AMAG_05602 [Allomyces macrogynus ATCC 38327]|uniref:C2H2-type domain-containing protein n=1 Tax=Allomyces macrogynus (strain ATCC 38327) TaxID=578462 RepID=A0A0L0SCA2_ALLM3|nr:hypothetical protein AMAG_05602 [Allomyces macrogynus ATCC 38327]|eukprot:KNE60183.1 hypothetical protein AMAG_05602 [Allomyces macrogynus ATCC 38327]
MTRQVPLPKFSAVEAPPRPTPDLKKDLPEKKALEMPFPTRTVMTPRNAQDRFILVQQAYEVLTDPQERAWYDAHRDQILRDADGDASGTGLSTDTLMRYFSSGIHSGFNDRADGFYAIYRNLFAQLFQEELAARDYAARDDVVALHPDWYRVTFGDTKADKATVDLFYGLWDGFATVKSFSWRDKWDLRNAPDRRIRRLMEKENKKLRETERREYVDTVKKLVDFIKKRDPRVKAFAEQAAQERQARQQQHLENLKKMKAAQAQAASDYVEQDWARVDYSKLDGFSDFDSDGGESDEDGIDAVADQLDDLELDHDLYCAACDKFLAGPEAVARHESTKAHAKRVAKLRQELAADDEFMERHTPISDQVDGDGEADAASPAGSEGHDVPSTAPTFECGPCEKVFTTQAQLDAHCKSKKHLKAVREAKAANKAKPASAKAGKSAPATPSPQLPSPPTVNDLAAEDVRPEAAADDDYDKTPSPVSKAKAKKAKKDKDSAAAAAADASTTHRCNVCSTDFTSRSKLFTHIKETGHALAVKFQGSTDDWDEIRGKGGKKKRR